MKPCQAVIGDPIKQGGEEGIGNNQCQKLIRVHLRVRERNGKISQIMVQFSFLDFEVG